MPKLRRGTVLAIVMLLTMATPLPAQENSFSKTLESLLRGGEATPAPGAVQRRVPLGSAEVQLSFAPLVKETAPAIVNVYASAKVQAASPFAGDPFFEQFFRGQRQAMPPRVQSSLGSGVIVDASGLVVTNFHVIRGADEVRVALPDGREFESTIMLKDESLDLAVLKIEGSEAFPVAPLGDSDALEIGDLVLAIGNPFGVGQTTTSGIVSALARTHIGVNDFGFFIQTDAAINPGNSGGGLINMAGEVVGINTAIFSRSGGSIGIGFAIPSNMVRAVVGAAKAGQDMFERPYIGAGFDPVTPQVAEALGMARPAGALVSSVDDDSPAAKAGLKPGDVVLKINQAMIEHPDALGYRLATQAIGSTSTMTVLRQGAETDLKLTLVRAPASATPAEVLIGGRSPFTGAKVSDLSPRLAQKLRIPTDVKGVVVVDLAGNSPAAGLGLRPGDIVREVNGEAIASPDDLRAAAEADTRWWRFSVERGGRLMRQVLRF